MTHWTRSNDAGTWVYREGDRMSYNPRDCCHLLIWAQHNILILFCSWGKRGVLRGWPYVLFETTCCSRGPIRWGRRSYLLTEENPELKGSRLRDPSLGNTKQLDEAGASLNLKWCSLCHIHIMNFHILTITSCSRLLCRAISGAICSMSQRASKVPITTTNGTK